MKEAAKTRTTSKRPLLLVDKWTTCWLDLRNPGSQKRSNKRGRTKCLQRKNSRDPSKHFALLNSKYPQCQWRCVWHRRLSDQQRWCQLMKQAPRWEEKRESCPVFNIRRCFEINKDRDVVERGWQDERRTMKKRVELLSLALFGCLCTLFSGQMVDRLERWSPSRNSVVVE